MKICRSKEALSRHLHNYCLIEKNIECSECDYRCKKQYTLNTHMRTQHPKPKYFCAKCQKAFFRKQDCKMHENECEVRPRRYRFLLPKILPETIPYESNF